MNSLNKYLIAGVSASLLFLGACSEDSGEGTVDNGQKVIDPELLDPNRSFNTNFDGKLFSVPSPVQTALLIRSSNLKYDESLLNSEKNIGNYTTNTSKSLNLGIYGADLVYTTLYDQNAKALSYLNAVESLSNDLGIAGAFDAKFLERFEANSNNQDSMLVILTDAFRKGDMFLKENDRKNSSALILTGGWLESMHFATNLYAKSKDKRIFHRIGEQKQSLQTILEILGEYNIDGVNDEILSQLNGLNELFKTVEITNEFVTPTTDESKKLTTIKNKSTMIMSAELEESIRKKVAEIRASIVGKSVEDK
jgi:hypothetical protein